MSWGLTWSRGRGPPRLEMGPGPTGGCHMTTGLFSCQNTRGRKDLSKSRREEFLAPLGLLEPACGTPIGQQHLGHT